MGTNMAQINIRYKLDIDTGRINVYLCDKKVGQIIKDKKDSMWFYRPKVGKRFDGQKCDGLGTVQEQLEGSIVVDSCHIPYKLKK